MALVRYVIRVSAEIVEVSDDGCNIVWHGGEVTGQDLVFVHSQVEAESKVRMYSGIAATYEKTLEDLCESVVEWADPDVKAVLT